MKKKDLRKKILLSYTKKLDEELTHQEELSKSSDIEIKLGANYTIGYITATNYYSEIFLSLIKKSKKGLKKWIKEDKRISKKNRKTFKKIFDKIRK